MLLTVAFGLVSQLLQGRVNSCFILDLFFAIVLVHCIMQ